MKNYIIDTDILIYFIKGQKAVVEKLSCIPPNQLYTTRISYTELMYGAYHSVRVNENLQVIRPFLANFQLLEFDSSASELFAQTKAKLKQTGQLIADMDLMIASIALAHDYALVSNNHKHFARIEGLILEDWRL